MAHLPFAVSPYKAATVGVVLAIAAGAGWSLGENNVLDGLHLELAVAARANFDDDGPPPGVAVIALDRRSLQAPEFADRPRALMQPQFAELLDGVFAAGAATLAFDFLFEFSARALDPSGERAFLAALRRHRSQVVLGRKGLVTPVRPYALALAPRASERLGLMEMIPDADGVIRRASMRYWLDESSDSATPDRLHPTPDQLDRAQPVPTLAGAAVAWLGEARVPNSLLLTPRRHLEALPTFSMIDVLRCARLDPDALAERLRGRVVFVGGTLPGEDRQWSTGRFFPAAPARLEPAERADMDAKCSLELQPASDPEARSIPGVHIQAQAAAQVLSGEIPAEVRPPWTHIMTAVAAGLGAFLTLAFPPIATIAVVAGVLAFGFAISLALLMAGVWLPLGVAASAMIIGAGGAYGARYRFEERDKRAVADAFSRYVAPELVDRIMADRRHLERGGEVRDLTVWIADIANYSTLAERVTPRETARVLNRIFGAMADVVETHGGYVTQYAGDAIVAVFGAFADMPDHADRGVLCALDALDGARRVAEDLEDELGVRLGLRVGISSDRMLAGNIGSARRLNFTIIGDGINLAARLESANKIFGTSILVSATTREKCSGAILFRLVDQVRVKGREQTLRIFEPLGPTDSVAADRRAAVQQFEDALAMFWRREFAPAERVFHRLAPEDALARGFAHRARAYQDVPPPADWTGVNEFTSK